MKHPFCFFTILLIQLLLSTSLAAQEKDSLIRTATYKMNHHDTLGALRDCTLAISINPGDAWAYCTRAWIKSCTGFITDAIVDYNYAIQINPHHRVPWFNLGELRLKLGLYKEAIIDFDHCLAIDTLFLSAYQLRAAAKCSLHLYKEAIADYDTAIKIAPHNYSYLKMGRGLVKYQAGLLQDALADYDQAIKSNPGLANECYQRAALNVELKNYKQVIADCKDAIRYDKRSIYSYTFFGGQLFAMGRKEEALVLLDKLVKRNSKTWSVYIARSVMEQQMYRQQDAQRDLEKAISLYPRQTDQFYLTSARNNISLYLYKQAIIDCDKGLAFNPANEILPEIRIAALKGLAEESPLTPHQQ